MNRPLLAAALALLAGACGGTTTPTPPPVIEDPPKITCPVLPPIQLLTGTTSAPITYVPTAVNGKPPVTIACAPASGTMFNVGTTTVTCTATDALQRANVCSFAITVLAVVPPPKLAVTRFLAFGDSITAGEDGVDGGPDTGGLCQPVITSTGGTRSRVILPDAQTYPGQLRSKLAARYQTQTPTMVNRGCPGESAAGRKTRARFDALVSTGQYDVVLIMEGSNDLFSASGADSATQLGVVGSAAAALRSLVGDAKAAGVRPLLATITPMSAAGRRGGGAGLVTSLNDRIGQIGSAENLAIVDVFGAFNGNLTLLGDDGLHPNANGYAVIAGAFFEGIKAGFEPKTSAPVLTFRRW